MSNTGRTHLLSRPLTIDPDILDTGVVVEDTLEVAAAAAEVSHHVGTQKVRTPLQEEATAGVTILARTGSHSHPNTT